MSKWVELPAQRVLSVSQDELSADFELINADGAPATEGGLWEIARRRKDNRVFRRASVQPTLAMPIFGLNSHNPRELQRFREAFGKLLEGGERWQIPVLPRGADVQVVPAIFLSEVGA